MHFESDAKIYVPKLCCEYFIRTLQMRLTLISPRDEKRTFKRFVMKICLLSVCRIEASSAIHKILHVRDIKTKVKYFLLLLLFLI